MEQQAEVVGPEAMVAEPIGLEGDLETLDRDRAVLGATARHVGIIDGQGRRPVAGPPAAER